MNGLTPHYLLFSEVSRSGDLGRWRFILRAADGSRQFEADDVEPDIRGERLDLLTVIRALESLDQPSRVTLLGCSPYVRRGVRYGLPQWRSNGWRWEYFGHLVPVKNGDLWQRMDRALRFHVLEYRSRRFDPMHGPPGVPNAEGNGKRVVTNRDSSIRIAKRDRIRYRTWLVPADRLRRMSVALRWWWRRASRSWTDWASCLGAG